MPIKRTKQALHLLEIPHVHTRWHISMSKPFQQPQFSGPLSPYPEPSAVLPLFWDPRGIAMQIAQLPMFSAKDSVA